MKYYYSSETKNIKYMCKYVYYTYLSWEYCFYIFLVKLDDNGSVLFKLEPAAARHQ
jgi:hypothetical protein